MKIHKKLALPAQGWAALEAISKRDVTHAEASFSQRSRSPGREMLTNSSHDKTTQAVTA